MRIFPESVNDWVRLYLVALITTVVGLHFRLWRWGWALYRVYHPWIFYVSIWLPVFLLLSSVALMARSAKCAVVGLFVVLLWVLLVVVEIF